MRGILIIAAMSIATPAMNHGGGLNAQGCHNDRRNGSYHCHPVASAPAPRPMGILSAPRRSSGGSYRNSAAARAAGAALVREGDPGYGSHLDRDGDGDGVGCE